MLEKLLELILTLAILPSLFLIPPPQRWNYRCIWPCPASYMGPGNLNSGPLSLFIEKVLPTELSSQPRNETLEKAKVLELERQLSAQWLRVMAALAEDLGSDLSTHMYLMIGQKSCSRGSDTLCWLPGPAGTHVVHIQACRLPLPLAILS